MDQESFRKLLQKPTATSPTSASSAHVRGSLLSAGASGKKKQKTVDASQPAFKPRTLKKSAKGQDYRDRATERRLGQNHDYAQVRCTSDHISWAVNCYSQTMHLVVCEHTIYNHYPTV